MGRRERKTEKSKQILIGVALALLMIMSGFGVFLGTQSNEMKYGKYRFEYSTNYPNERIVLKLDKKTELPFYYLPQETEFINLSSAVTNKVKEAFFIMTSFDPEARSLQEIALVNYYFNTYLKDQSGYNKIIMPGLLKESPDYALPVITCANATLQTPVIIFNNSDTTSIVDEDNCIYFNARGIEFLRLRDRLVYSYYSVIQDE
jgi:hypothetical protein